MVERKELPNDIRETVDHRTLNYRERFNEPQIIPQESKKERDEKAAQKKAMNAALTARRRAIEEHQARKLEEDSEWLSEKNTTA